MRTVLRWALVACMVLVASAGTAPARAASDHGGTAVGLVHGPWRVMAYQTVVGAQLPAFGLATAPEGVWVAMVADVTNLGAAAAFDPATLTIGVTTGSPLSMVEGIPADAGRTVSATQALGLQGLSPDGVFAVAENGIVRLAAIFALPAAPAGKEHLVLRVGDQVASLADTVIEAYDAERLPAFAPAMSLRQVSVVEVPGNSRVTVAHADGTSETIVLAGIQTPAVSTADTGGCFGTESATAVTSLSGGTLWLESVPGAEGQMAWINDVSSGTFTPLNAQLVQQGLAGVVDGPTPYTSWFQAIEEYVKGQGAGLWAVCRNAEGVWITPPTPTPVPTPSAEQIRAQYAWIDSRDLVIRPMEFQGEKIAIQGSVFNIQVDGGVTAMQIWIDGSNEAVVVIYEGDSRGIYEGTWVTVYGVGAGTFEGTNGFGAVIVQPMVFADIVDF